MEEERSTDASKFSNVIVGHTTKDAIAVGSYLKNQKISGAKAGRLGS